MVKPLHICDAGVRFEPVRAIIIILVTISRLPASTLTILLWWHILEMAWSHAVSTWTCLSSTCILFMTYGLTTAQNTAAAIQAAQAAGMPPRTSFAFIASELRRDYCPLLYRRACAGQRRSTCPQLPAQWPHACENLRRDIQMITATTLRELATVLAASGSGDVSQICVDV